MATYGSRDQNLFIPPKTYKINGVETDSNLGEGKYYTIVEADGPNKGQITIKSPTAAGSLVGQFIPSQGANTDRTVGVITPGKPIEITPGIPRNEEKYFKSVAGQTTVKGNAKITAQRGGLDDNSAQQLISPGSPTSPNKPSEGGNIDQEGIDKLKGAAGEYKGRKDYTKNLKYPVNINAELQDCIKFQIIEYKASRLGLSNQNPTLRTNSGTGRTLLSSIFLPMPSGGISDRNSVSWGEGRLDLAATAFSATALGFLEGGAKGATDAAKNDIDLIMGKDGKNMLGELVKAKSLEAALGTNNLLSRLSGLAVNPSLELLFEGPSLREFSFSFKMTPRSKKEAQEVRSIIRTFKQAMSVKRSESVLLLKAPHTFRISYLTSTKDHPYLNRFKECALTGCSVNYTPDNSYMSYDDSDPDGRSMTAYELTLSFNELEPIFDDDYENMEGAVGSFNHIGY